MKRFVEIVCVLGLLFKDVLTALFPKITAPLHAGSSSPQHYSPCSPKDSRRLSMVPTRRLFSVLAIVMLVTSMLMAATGSAAPLQKPETKTLIVKMAKGVTLAQAQEIVNRGGGKLKRSIPKLDFQIVEVPAYAVDAVTKSFKADAAVLRVEESL